MTSTGSLAVWHDSPESVDASSDCPGFDASLPPPPPPPPPSAGQVSGLQPLALRPSIAVVQHVAQNHSEWMTTTPQGHAWVEELNAMVDNHEFKSSFLGVCWCPVSMLHHEKCHNTIDPARAPPENWPPLLMAVWHDSPESVEYLLNHHPIALAQINDGPQKGDDRGPLYHAVQGKCHPWIIQLLLQARADPHQRVEQASRTPGRARISTTPFRVAQGPGWGPIKEAFDAVLFPGVPPPPTPPDPPTAIQLARGRLFIQ